MPRGNHNGLWWIVIGIWWRPLTFLFTRRVSEKDVVKEMRKQK